MEQPYRVILVEDSAAIRETLIHALEASGLLTVVGTAETAADARAIISTTPTDAVIIDLQLRDSTGFEVLANIRKSSPDCSPVKIVLTNYATGVFRKRSEQFGADYFFDKSLEFNCVIETLYWLAGRRMNQDSHF